MKYLKLYENWRNFDTPSKNKIWAEINDIKKSIFDKMDPNPIDVWYTIDDHILDLKDGYGKFVTKYEDEKDIIDFYDIDINSNFSRDKTNYTLFHIRNYKWKRGEKIELEDAHVENSLYGDFDYEFYKYYQKIQMIIHFIVF
jgi:hypothetical protein